MSEIAAPEVRVGQVWADKDPRMAGRTIRVESITQDRVVVTTLSVARDSLGRSLGKTSIINRNRLRPTSTGCDLVKDVPEDKS